MIVVENEGEEEEELSLFTQPDHVENQKRGTQLLSLEVTLANQQIGLLVVVSPKAEGMYSVWVQLFACRGNFDRLQNLTVRVFEWAGELIQEAVVEHGEHLYLNRFQVLPDKGFSMQLEAASQRCTKTFVFN